MKLPSATNICIS